MVDAQSRILEAIARGAYTVEDVRRETGYRFTTQAIRRHLGKLAKAGILKHTPESWEYEV